MSRSFDVVVIGAGPAGYVAAIRAAQHGMSVACIDDWKNKDGKNAFGGTCLNAGCIPSKAMLESSELLHRAQHEFKKHGINVGAVKLDLGTMQKRRASIVRQLRVESQVCSRQIKFQVLLVTANSWLESRLNSVQLTVIRKLLPPRT